MTSLIFELTGQKLVLDRLLSDAASPHRLLVCGAAGSGKRTLCDVAAKEWEVLDSAIALNLNMDSHKPELEYAPFYSAVDSVPGEKKHALNSILREAGKDVPFIGNTLSALIDLIMQRRKLQESFHLPEEEKVICRLIERKVKGKIKVLLICQNVDMWEPGSQNLLGAMLNGQAKVEGLNAFSFLITCDSITPLIKKIASSCLEHSLAPIPPNAIKNVLQAFNPGLLCSNEQEKLLSSVSGGNLQILKECSQLFGLYSAQPTASSSFWRMLEARIQREVENSDNLVELLKRLSVIGYRSERELLHKFTEDCIEDQEIAICSGINLKLINETPKSYEFSSMAIRELAYESISARQAQYHKQLEQCIYILYPSAYKERAEHSFLGGEKRKAAVLYVVSLIFHLRATGCEIRILDEVYIGLMKEFGLDDLYDQIKDAYFLYFKNEYQLSKEILDRIYAEDLEIRFEVDYLHGLIISNWTCASDIFSEKLDMLYHWNGDEFKATHLEMWLRATMLLAELLHEIGETEKGSGLIRTIMPVFDKKSPTDIRIKNLLYTFHLKANQFYSVETAYARVEQAQRYFTPTDGQNIHLTKYYLALVNQAANLTVMGQADAGFARANEAKKLLLGFPDINFAKQEVLVNNYVLSGYLSGTLSSADALAELAAFRGKMGNYADELLINNTIAAFLAIEGNIEEAANLSELLYEYITAREDNDPYYAYFLMNNYAVICCLAKRFKLGFEVFAKTTNIIPLLRDRQYFIQRNELIRNLVKSNFFKKLPTDWNTHLITASPHTVGQCWPFWGRLLLFSDLQVWTDI